MTFANAKGPRDADTVVAAPPARVFVGLKIAPEIASRLAQLAATLEQPFVRPVAPADISRIVARNSAAMYEICCRAPAR